MLKQLLSSLVLASSLWAFCGAESEPDPRFERVQLYPISRNNPKLARTAAEIVALTADGNTLVYADSLGGGLGFVDVSDPSAPEPLGWIELEGEPTSVTIKEDLVLVVTASPESYRGSLVAVDLLSRREVKRWELPGQPDCIDLSPDQRYLAICLENESLEQDFPQPPPGSLAIVGLDKNPADWTLRYVDLTGLAALFPQDPEPEYVTINDQNMAAVSLQENNHVVLIDLESALVKNHFSAGSVSLEGVDLKKDKRLRLTQKADEVAREPDSLEWCSLGILTADEGDYLGGARSFSIFSAAGEVRFWSENQTEVRASRLGQYPDHRSDNRGTEPESLAVAVFEGREFLFIGCERANLVYVYEVVDSEPVFFQALYAGPGPESIVACPSRGLLFLGSEVNEPEHRLHSYLSVYRFGLPQQSDVHIVSQETPWQSLSGLTTSNGRLYAVMDKAVRPSQVLSIDTNSQPYQLTTHTELLEDFDLEGICARADGGFWMVAEGSKKRPDQLLLWQEEKLKEIPLPDWVTGKSKKHGLEGVAEIAGEVYVGFQSGWKDDPPETTRIGRYSPIDGSWDFVLYPLQSGHFLSGLCSGPNGQLCILERDKEAREYADHKVVYAIDPKTFETPLLAKTQLLDLVAEFRNRNLPVPAKLEGITWDGQSFWVVNDNDGVKDSYGETILLKVDPKHSSNK